MRHNGRRLELTKEEEKKVQKDEEKNSMAVHLYNRGTDQWFDVQDLYIEEQMQQVITQSEAYIQVYERQ